MTSLCSYPGKVDNLKKLIFWTLDIVFPHSTRAGGKRYVTETQGVSEYHRYQVYPSRSGFDQRSQPRICGTSCSNRKKRLPKCCFTRPLLFQAFLRPVPRSGAPGLGQAGRGPKQRRSELRWAHHLGRDRATGGRGSRGSQGSGAPDGRGVVGVHFGSLMPVWR